VKVTLSRDSAKEALADASTMYLEAEERAIKNKELSDSVLVSVDNLRSLRRAYPNYFSDTTVFISAIERAIA
jgi:putative GTP pyrophosphokinase